MWFCFGSPSVRDIHSTQLADDKDFTYSRRLEGHDSDDSLSSIQEAADELALISREREERISEILELEQCVCDLEERLQYPEPAAEIAGCLLDKPTLISKSKQLYVWLTIDQSDRVAKGWSIRDANLRWSEYVDDASEEEEHLMSHMGFTPEVLREMRWHQPHCPHRATAAAHDTTADCLGSSADSGKESYPWRQLRGWVKIQAQMGQYLDDDYN